MLASAHVLVARPAKQNRAGNEFERPAEMAVTETALADIGKAEGLVLFRIGCVVRASVAPVVGHRHRSAPHEGRGRHMISRVLVTSYPVIETAGAWPVNRVRG